MPVYFAGWIRGDGTIRFGGGFQVVRMSMGTYRITIQATSSGKFLTPLVGSSGVGVFARVVGYTKNGLDLSHTIDLEIRGLTGALVDGEFTFIALDRS